MAQELPELYTVDEVAQRLRCTPQHVYNLMNRGELRSIKLGRCRRIRHSDLADMLDAAAA